MGKRVKRSAHGSSGIQHVVRKHNPFICYRKRKLGIVYNRLFRYKRKIVPVIGYIYLAAGNPYALYIIYVVRYYFCNRNSAALYTYYTKIFGAAVSFKYLWDILLSARFTAASSISVALNFSIKAFTSRRRKKALRAAGHYNIHIYITVTSLPASRTVLKVSLKYYNIY